MCDYTDADLERAAKGMGPRGLPVLTMQRTAAALIAQVRREALEEAEKDCICGACTAAIRALKEKDDGR